MSATPKVVVGLGNPGLEYEGTRHNVGFAVLDRLAAGWNCSFRSKTRFMARVAEATVDTGKVVLAKPQTYMNRSGASVSALLNWLKFSPADLLAVVDDADLPLGQIRLRASGGSGGHNGLRSVIEALGGNEQFARLRIGIGRPSALLGSGSGPVGADITDHVLGRFLPQERAVVEEVLSRATDAVLCCVQDGVPAAMNQFNRKAEREGEQL